MCLDLEQCFLHIPAELREKSREMGGGGWRAERGNERLRGEGGVWKVGQPVHDEA